MRTLFMAASLALVLAGCAETPIETTDAQPLDDVDQAGQNTTALLGALTIELSNSTVTSGETFTLFLDYDGSDADKAQMAWVLDFQNATDGVSVNGTGLPAAPELNLTLLGNVTLSGTASHGNDTVILATQTLQVLPAEVPEVDPCLDATVQEPITGSGSTLLPGDVGSHEFEVLPCQSGLHIAVDILIGGDMDYYLYDPTGAEADGAAAFGAEGIASEGDLSVAGPLAPGTWRLDIENFASLATDYDYTITFG